MPRFFLPAGNPESGFLTIIGDDAKHISFSLRMRRGERLTVCDGAGTDYDCVITDMDGQTVTVKVDAYRPSVSEMPFSVRLYQSVPKGDKFDYIVQKAVELGIHEIVPVFSARCIVKPDAGSEAKRTARLGKIAQEAAKQSGRGVIPRILPSVSFSEAVARCANPNADEYAFLCYEEERARSLKAYLGSLSGKEIGTVSFFVGPEGGYTPEEAAMALDAGIPSVKFGERILRAETASGFVLACLSYEFETFEPNKKSPSVVGQNSEF